MRGIMVRAVARHNRREHAAPEPRNLGKPARAETIQKSVSAARLFSGHVRNLKGKGYCLVRATFLQRREERENDES
jgi:hypothetical protein